MSVIDYSHANVYNMNGNVIWIRIEVEVSLVKLMNVTLQIPEEMKFVFTPDDSNSFERNALLLYPYIMRSDISNGRAAEILGVSKLELIDHYEKQGLMCLQTSINDVNDDINTLKQLRG